VWGFKSELAPNNPSVLGTRGSVLVALGRVKEGRKLLKRSLKLHRHAQSRSSVLASLALASVRQGRGEDARQLLKRARAMDASCELLSRVEHELDDLAGLRGSSEPAG
jgi:Flp pilus assembly protein TadD